MSNPKLFQSHGLHSPSRCSSVSTSRPFYHSAKCLLLLAVALTCRVTAASQAIQMVAEFQESGKGPQVPYGRLVLGTNGAFYGTTFFGGNSDLGTVFKFSPGSAPVVLTAFNGANGQHPYYGGLMRAADGNFYGNTYLGGVSNSGTIFRISHEGAFTNLVSFRTTNGASPRGWLTQAADGNFYGTTFGGGVGNRGTVYRMTPAGALNTIHFFNNTNGANPDAGLVEAPDGGLYGTTLAGGTNNLGTIFRITTNGLLTSLISFTGTNGTCPGSSPFAALVRGSNGYLYGTTQLGGNADYGTVFRVSTNGDFTTLHSFSATNGAYPEASLVEGADGWLYGTTAGSVFDGGSATNGTVFAISLLGQFSSLANFDYTVGPEPVSSLTLGADGNFYGTTLYGGLEGLGALYRLVTPPIITAIAATNGSVTLTWTAFSNGVYRVEHKPAVDSPGWTPLATNIIATGNTASRTDNPGNTNRIYRVNLLP